MSSATNRNNNISHCLNIFFLKKKNYFFEKEKKRKKAFFNLDKYKDHCIYGILILMTFANLDKSTLMNEIYADVFQKIFGWGVKPPPRNKKLMGKSRAPYQIETKDMVLIIWYPYDTHLAYPNRSYIILFIYLQYVEIRGWAQFVRIEAPERLSKNQKQKLFNVLSINWELLNFEKWVQ